MAQHDYNIGNGSGATVRSDLNNVLAAIISQNSGATEPSTTGAYQWWADTTTGILKIRNAADGAWVNVGLLDTANLGLLLASNNLSDLVNAGTARTNMGLGDSATKDTGTGSGDVAAGDHTHIGISFRGAKANTTVGVSVAHSTTVEIPFASEDFDTDSIHDNSTNNDRLTVPSGVTKIRLSAAIDLDEAATAVTQALIISVIRKNGADVISSDSKSVPTYNAYAHYTTSTTTGVITVTGGDYFTIEVMQENDTGETFTLSGDSDLNWFQMEII
jgi:hypothetical protein